MPEERKDKQESSDRVLTSEVEEAEESQEQSSLNYSSEESDDSADEEDNDDGSMSLLAHLEELRWRLIRSIAAIVICSGICYFFIEEIMSFISEPVGKLYYLQPSEAFFTYLKVSICCGFILALPVVFYQLWCFVLPALTIKERYIAAVIVPSSVILFLSGLAFSFFLVMPAALKFFGGFGSDTLLPMFSVARYFDFLFSFILPFGFVFELPLVIVIAAKLGLLTSKFLGEKQRYVIFFSFVIGAIITPTPDIFTQTMIALPMIILYELSYVIVKFILRK
ncbi:MAG: twin-arginine translocase subunit TatC [Selenomonadaceae bacterium]|nr:twin-arginine translocase subunit TatC [Selenomonadaceae bacterium]